MRLLFVTSFYPPLTGGGSSRIHDFSRLLASIGFEVTVLTFSPFQSLLQTTSSKEARVIRLPTLGFKHPLDQVFLGFVGTMLINAARAQDFVIASVPMGEPCIGAFLACSILSRRIVVDIRDEWEDVVINRTRRLLTRNLYRLYKRLFNSIYRKSAFVATVTPTLAKRVRQRGVGNAYIVPNGADTELFHPTSKDERTELRRKIGLQPDDFVVAYAGRVGWYYRIDTVIEALNILVKEQQLESIKLLVVGAGEKLRDYLNLAKKLDLGRSVLFLGEKSREEVAKILSWCDLGVIPFDDDPIWLSAYTTKVFEYCASGLPVIVSVATGADLERLVKKHAIGFATEPMDPEQVAKAILEAYRDKGRYRLMQANARRLAVEEFDRKKIAEKLAHILETHRGA